MTQSSNVQALTKVFTEVDRKRIEAAVKQAEGQTSGEIVPYVVESSDLYEEAEWKASALLGLVVLLAFVLLHRLTEVWLPVDLLGATIAVVAAAVVGVLLARHVYFLKRFFAGRKLMARRVHQRAVEAFVAEEVFDTNERTGILIFLSLVEHQVLVLGDSGINAKVQQHEWEGVVRVIIDSVKKGKVVDGLVTAIQQCGQLLQRQGVERRPDDKDELPDYLRIGDTPEP